MEDAQEAEEALPALIASSDEETVRPNTTADFPTGERWREYQAFVAARIETESSKEWVRRRKSKGMSKKRKEAAGKTLNFRKSSETVQEGLLQSRKTEWEKWMQFCAAEIISETKAQSLINDGFQPIGMQWIETDKHEHLRLPGGPPVDPLYKSRLVARGDQEQGEIRSDSPTCDIEGQNLIFSFAASHNLTISSADISNAYFQGEEQTRLLLLRQPQGGLPDVAPGDMLLARVPIYGTRDAGRSFWKRLRTTFLGIGFQENRILKALYSYARDGVVLCIIGTHVDDLLWACKPEAQHIIDEVLASFKFGKIDKSNFRYCGKQVTQDEDFTIHINCKDTILKTGRIRIANGRRMQDEVTPDERTQLKSVAGSLSWVARQCRPDISYRVSKMQSTAGPKCRVADLKEANKVLEYAIQTAEKGLTFRSGVLDWNTMISGVVCDASHANEEEVIDAIGNTEPHRSQGARLQILATPNLGDGDECHFHLIGHGSTIVKRVCRSTVQAEAYSLQAGVEEGDRLRAAVADLRGHLDMKCWESSSTASMKQIWITDCKSVEQVLLRPTLAKMADKRLSIEVASLRQSLWRRRGDSSSSPMIEDDRPSDVTDHVRWIDTDVMIADPLTKQMDAGKLNEALTTNYWSFKQPVESVLKKRAKQLARRKTVPEAQDCGHKRELEGDDSIEQPYSKLRRYDERIGGSDRLEAIEMDTLD
jgi:hypothetical protein